MGLISVWSLIPHHLNRYLLLRFNSYSYLNSIHRWFVKHRIAGFISVVALTGRLSLGEFCYS